MAGSTRTEKGGYACKCVCTCLPAAPCEPGCRARHIVPEVRPAIVVFGHGMWGSYVDLLKGLSLSVASRSRLPGPTFAGYDRILSGPKQAVLRAAWRSWIGMRYHTGMLSVQRLW